jgi:hypothetical protein
VRPWLILLALVPAATAAAEPTRTTARGRRLLDGAVAAHGGRARLLAIESLRRALRVRFTVGANPIELVHVVTATPDARRDEVDGPRGPAVEVVTPHDAWVRAADGTIRTLPEDRAEVARDRHALSLEWLARRARERGTAITALPRQTIDGARYDAVRVSRGEGRGATVLLLDRRTRLVVQQSFEAPQPEGKVTVRYRDYRVVAGIRLPFAEVEVYGNSEGTVETIVDAVEVNPQLPPGHFDRPPEGASASP